MLAAVKLDGVPQDGQFPVTEGVSPWTPDAITVPSPSLISHVTSVSERNQTAQLAKAIASADAAENKRSSGERSCPPPAPAAAAAAAY